MKRSLIIKILLIIIIWFGNISYLSADNIWYFSPGIRIGLNPSGNFTVDGKISLGICDNFSGKITFYNITLGFNALTFTKTKGNQFNEYNYVQFQTGGNFFEDNILISGLGVGFIFKANGKRNFSPILRFFSGFLIFPELDLIFIRSKQIHSIFGVRGILPIPMKKIGPLYN
jgi:hypothetical protein